MSPERHAFDLVLHTLRDAAAASGRPCASLLAVSKTQPAQAVAALAAWGQRDFGENYVAEAIEKVRSLAALRLRWHLIGHLQSNKCRAVAEHFDWVQSIDRERIIEPLDRYRPASLEPLSVLIQVNPEGEAGKSGCAPGEIAPLAAIIRQSPRLRLRGLMAIPEPTPDLAQRQRTFASLHAMYRDLASGFPEVNTLSMGMSEDYRLAIAEGATMVRIGSALFGARS